MMKAGERYITTAGSEVTLLNYINREGKIAYVFSHDIRNGAMPLDIMVFTRAEDLTHQWTKVEVTG